MTKKSTKRALISSLLVLAMCFTMLAGTTFAWFTDSVSSTGNRIISGKLSIDLLVKADGDTDYVSVKANPNKAVFDYDLWEPGYTSWANAKVATDGNLALKYTMKIVANGSVSALADVIDVYYAASEIAKPATRPADLTTLGLTRIGTLRDALNGTVVINDTLIPGQNAEDAATIVLHMQETAGNEYQEMSIGSNFAFQILATQYTYEADAFDNQYDVDAEWPAIKAPDRAALREAIAEANNGDVITLTGDIDNYIVINNDKDISIDLNQKTMTGDEDGVLFVYDGGVTVDNGTIDATTNSNNSGNAQAVCIVPIALDTTPHVVIGENATLKGDFGLTVFPAYNNGSNPDKAANATIDIYGKVEGPLFISGNVESGNVVVNVYGEIDGNGDIGIAVNGHATVNIMPGAKVKGTTGIEVRAGNLNVKGGEIEGISVPTTVTSNGNGTTSTGAGIAVCQHTTKLPINVSISGGTIKGYTALYEANPENNSDADLGKITINVTGGTFTPINGGTNKFGIEDQAKIHYTNALA